MWCITKDNIRIELEYCDAATTPDKAHLGGLRLNSNRLFLRWKDSRWFDSSRYFNTNSSVGVKLELAKLTLEELIQKIDRVDGEELTVFYDD